MSVGLKQCDMVLYRPDSRLVLLLLLCIKIWIPVPQVCTQLTAGQSALACLRKLDHRTLLLQARLSAIGRKPDTLCADGHAQALMGKHSTTVTAEALDDIGMSDTAGE